MSKFDVVSYLKPPAVENNKRISMFKEMDIYKPPPLNIKVYVGQPGPDFVRESCNGCIQLMYDLKKEIGHLSERSQLSHLKSHPIPVPVKPNFDPNNPDHDMMAQAFYQDALYYHEFVTDYTSYLEDLVQKQTTNFTKMDSSSTSFYRDIANQLYLYNYKINGTDFFTVENFIEQKHKMAEFQGEVFYLNLIKAMPTVGDRIADPAKGEIQTPREKVFLKVLEYCKTKIQPMETRSNHPKQPVVFFSYAWNEESSTFVASLYDSLQKKGINVVRDTVDLKYSQSISDFMRTIGKGDFIIVALSDKYLKSESCMFELCEVYRNSKQDMDELRRRILPVRIENIQLGVAGVVEKYLDYWKDQEQQWKALVNKHSYDQQQHRRVESIYNSSRDLLFFLKDINAFSLELLTENDFSIIKNTIGSRIQNGQG